MAAPLIVAVGIALRLDHYLAGHGLWLDEAYLAINILERPPWKLLGPLEYDQHAPFGFLLLQKLAVTVFGPSELSLRALPLACGVMILVVFVRILHDSGVDPMSRLVALTLVAFSGVMIRYSGELKQYSLECLVGLLLYLCARPLLRSPDAEAPRAAALRYAIAGAAALWFSLTAILMLAGINFALLVAALRGRSRQATTTLAAISAAHLVMFAVVYWADLRHTASSAWLYEYWQHSGGLPSNELGPVSSIAWGFRRFAQTARDAVLPMPAEITAVLLLAALGWAALSADVWLIAVLAPIVLLIGAIAHGSYPAAQRLLIFAIPNVAVSMAVGLRSCWNALRVLPVSIPSAPWALGMAVVLIAVLRLSEIVGASAPYREDIRPLLETLDKELEGGDVVYVYYGAQPAFRYYNHVYPGRFDERDRAIAVVNGRRRHPEWERFAQDFVQLEGKPRVWLLFAHGINRKTRLDEIEASRDHLAKKGRLVESWLGYDTALYLFDLRSAEADGREPGVIDTVGL